MFLFWSASHRRNETDAPARRATVGKVVGSALCPTVVKSLPFVDACYSWLVGVSSAGRW